MAPITQRRNAYAGAAVVTVPASSHTTCAAVGQPDRVVEAPEGRVVVVERAGPHPGDGHSQAIIAVTSHWVHSS